MPVTQMRAAITKSYPGEKWQRRVKMMSDKQVAATYMRLMCAKKL